MFKGSLVALITPMRPDGSLDEEAFARFVDWQVREGSDGIVPVGTTGESPTLTHAEHRRVVEIAIEAARGRVPVIAGAGSNSTAEAIELARHA
jgi:4-hydroxy-tetrahydrodipicolinate synthase